MAFVHDRPVMVGNVLLLWPVLPARAGAGCWGGVSMLTTDMLKQWLLCQSLKEK